MLARRTVGRELCEFHASISSFEMSSSMVNRLELIHPLPASPSDDVCSGDGSLLGWAELFVWQKAATEKRQLAKRVECMSLLPLVLCVAVKSGSPLKPRKVSNCVASLVIR